MNRPVSHELATDHAVQQLHAQALQQLSPATLARLRSARHAPAHRRTRTWWMATACSALVALALGYGFSADPPGSAAPPGAITTLDDSGSMLDENPDLYVWLGTTDLAME